ncbi:MAG: 30S ribosomal protein S24e [Candidatus Thermoplasmatota archaeon]|nr:30S ribosomal protein S24e [Candidatus Thermoplasmatota archaeon]
MEIEIHTKTNNPLLNRIEVHFTVLHTGEQTPKRELIRSELADKLNVKKEQIIVDNMQTHFGITKTIGYAKIYKSIKEAQHYEEKYLLKRNKALATEKQKEDKSAEKQEEPKGSIPTKTPTQPPKEETISEDKKGET